METESIKDIANRLLENKSCKVDRDFIEKVIYNIFKYYLDKEPDGEFIKNYGLDHFEFKVALKYYMNKLTNRNVNVKIRNNKIILDLE